MGLIIEGLRFRQRDILTPSEMARILSLRGTTGRRVREGEAPGKIYYYERVRDPQRLRVRDEMELLLEHPEMKERFTGGEVDLEKALLNKAIGALKHAKAESSKFKVGAAALTLDGKGRRWLVMGWNREPLNDDSTHAEESIVAKMGPDEVIMNVAAVGQNHQILSPCGDCRDFLSSWADASAKALISEKTWIPLAVLFPGVFPEISAADLSQNQQKLLQEAQGILEGAYAPHSNRPKGAAILTSKGNFFHASILEDVAYHHDHPIEIALGMIDANRQRMVEEVAVYNGCSGREAHTPCGRCRQKLNRASQISNKDFRVLMTSGDGKIYAATVSQLLPYPFGPAELGIDLSRYRTL